MAKGKRIKKTGLPPGSVVFTGDQKVEQIMIHYMAYNESNLEEQVLYNIVSAGLSHSNHLYVKIYKADIQLPKSFLYPSCLATAMV